MELTRDALRFKSEFPSRNALLCSGCHDHCLHYAVLLLRIDV